MASREDEMSRDELRKKLFQTFKDKGILDSIKAQLRNQLIQELKPRPLSRSEPAAGAQPLLVTACNNIIADHLQHFGHDYTLSVFYPDCGLSKEKILRREDLLQLLKVHPDSELYISELSSTKSNGQSFLMNLLTHLTHCHTPTQCRDTDTQTAASRYGESLVDKLKMIDQEYEGAVHKDSQGFSFQSRLESYKKELEAQMEMELNAKIEHFKSMELAKMRMEEKSQFQKEFHKVKQDLEKSYEMKAKALHDREKNAIDRLQKQQEIEEKNMYMERQVLLKESEKLRNRENELKCRMESLETTFQLHQEKVKATEDLLRRRELAVRTLEDTHDQRLKNELSRYQLELKEEYIKRTETLTANENKNKEETARIHKELAFVSARLEEHTQTRAELQRLQVELETAEQQTSLLSQQNERLKERLDHMSDYSVLRKEKVQLQGQVQLLERQLDEAQEQNRLLSADVRNEEQSLQLELRRLQSARRLDEEEFKTQKQVLQTQLQAEVERCGQLKVQLMESEERTQWMATHMEEIKTQLRQTQQALENEVLRNPKPSLVDRSVLELSPNRLVPSDVFVERGASRSRTGHDDVCKAGGLQSSWKGSPDCDKKLVAEAKAQILELWKEAETLQEAFRNYQQMAAQPPTSQLLPSRPFSPPQFPKPNYTPTPFLSDLRKTSAPARPHVPNLTDKPRLKHSSLFTDLHSVGGSPQIEQSPPSPKKPPRRSTEDLSEEVLSWHFTNQMPHVPDPEALHDKLSRSGHFSPELPRSPQLQSTARDPPSAPPLHPVGSSTESSPKPESINIEDLTEELPEAGHIPELLLDTGVPLSKQAPDGPSVPLPQTPPRDVRVHSPSSEEPPRHSPEDEEARWEQERRERQEQRRLEQEEAREKELQELQELERMEREMAQQPGEESGGEEKDEEPKPAEENPLDKYMKMVLEAREKQHTESPKLEAPSPELKTLSEEKEVSDVQFSQHEADNEDDFW
ncbi:centriole and centriolar satellite protein ofd1 isoform 2-T2 [Synchiropus picturatus]